MEEQVKVEVLVAVGGERYQYHHTVPASGIRVLDQVLEVKDRVGNEWNYPIFNMLRFVVERK